MSLKLAACIATAVASFAAGAGELYKCESGNHSRYQNAPCPHGTKQSVVANPTLSQQLGEGDPRTGTFTPEAQKLHRQVEETIGVLATYPVCAQSDPAYAKAHAAQFDAWKKKNGAFIRRVESDPAMKGALDNGIALEKKRAADPAERAKQAGECTHEIARALTP